MLPFSQVHPQGGLHRPRPGGAGFQGPIPLRQGSGQLGAKPIGLSAPPTLANTQGPSRSPTAPGLLSAPSFPSQPVRPA